MKSLLPMVLRRRAPDAAPHNSRPRRGVRGVGRGFALPVVLLILAAMSVLAVRLVDRSQTSVAVARAHQHEAIARHAADAGYELFLVRYVASQSEASELAVNATVASARVAIRAENEGGKVDLNTGGLVLLAGVFRAAGADAKRAETLTEWIAAFRETDGGQIFHTTD